jgi:hypothetical protein
MDAIAMTVVAMLYIAAAAMPDESKQEAKNKVCRKK